MRRFAMRAWVVALANTLTSALVSPVHAQELAPSSAVLLGAQRCQYALCDSVSTVLVVRQGDRVRVVARAPGLLVPRREGFWWLGLEHGVAGGYVRDEDGDLAGALAACDSVVLGLKAPPSDSAAGAEESEGEDDGDEAPSLPSGLWAVRADASAAAHVLRSGGSGRIMVRWVGSEWISTSEYTSYREDSEHTRESMAQAIVRFADFERPASDTTPSEFAPVDPAFRRAEQACRRSALAGITDPDDRALEAERARIEWTVRRRAKSWVVAPLIASTSRYADTEPEPCAVPAGMGASMVGWDRVTVPWSAIKDVLPEARTAFESPAGDLLLVLQDSTVHAFVPRAGAPGPEVARFTLPGQLVMVQWAVGAHAARWTRDVPPLLAEGAPAFAADSSSRR